MNVTVASSDYQYILQIDVYPLTIDWTIITDDMRDCGLSYSRQALAIGKGWSSMQRFREGVTPRFPEAHALLILHSKVCGIELTRKRLSEADPSQGNKRLLTRPHS